MVSKYVVSDEEFGGRVAAMNRESPRRAYIEPGAKEPKKDEPPGEPPRPLTRELSAADEFPITALGDVLHNAAKAINDIVRAPMAICGQSVLAAATLAVQSRANIELPTGEIKPISEYYLTVAETGERKTASDSEALRPIRDYETKLRTEYDNARPDYENAMIAWEKARDHAVKQARGNQSAIKMALEKIGAPPPAPLIPLLTCPEPTYEGLIKALAIGQPSLGIFSDEGGQFIGGHGMTDEAKLRTASGLSDAWDGKVIVRVRSGDGVSVLPGRRVSSHLMAQPDVASKLLADGLLLNQGFLSRCLTTAPDSNSGQRLWRDPTFESFAALKIYRDKIMEILETPLPLAKGKTNELLPSTMTTKGEARKLWTEYADKIERQMATGCALVPIKGLANKLAQHSSRLAAGLALVANIEARTLPAEFAANGIILAEHYSAEALRLFEAGQVSPDLAMAQKLLGWLRGSWAEPQVSLPDIYRNGPNAIRDKATASRLVGILEDHGWLTRVIGGAEVAGQFRRDVWSLVKEDKR